MSNKVMDLAGPGIGNDPQRDERPRYYLGKGRARKRSREIDPYLGNYRDAVGHPATYCGAQSFGRRSDLLFFFHRIRIPLCPRCSLPARL